MLAERTRSGPRGSSLKLRLHVRWFFIMKDKEYLQLAYQEALKAAEIKETPVGCVIVYNDKIIGISHNTTQQETNPLLHAEILALEQAFKNLKSKNLKGAKIYISLEPCLMCLGAIINAHISEIYFSALDKKKGAFSFYNVSMQQLNVHYIESKKAGELLTSFFASLR